MALLSIAAAGLSAYGDSGRERLAALMRAEPSVVAKTNPAEDISRLYANIAQLRSETRLLSLEKQALATKLAEMESGMEPMGPVTASIPPRATALEATVVAPDPVAGEPSPLDDLDDADEFAIARFAHPEARDSTQLTRTRFAIEVGTGSGVDTLRARWERLLARAPAIMDGLEPLVALNDGDEDEDVTLRLLAGPFDDFAAAAALCADLEVHEMRCRAVPMEGRALVMR